MKIAIVSLADINNYGDAFFPVIVEEELKKRLPDAQIDLITNTIYNSGFYETKKYCYEELKEYDAIILGGGELISPYDNEAFCKTYGEGYKGKPSDIAHGWLDIPKVFKAWFSVGAHPVLYDYPDEVDCALESLDYLSVRGNISKKVLEKGFVVNNGNIRVIPDLGWLFPRYIDDYQWFEYEHVCKIEGKEEYCVFQAIDDADINKNLEMITRVLVDFQRNRNIKVLLLPIMQTAEQWMEKDVMERISAMSGNELEMIPYGLNIKQTGIILKNAKFFVGSSLHGAVTALAYGKPVVNIRSGVNTKLQDLHAARFRSTCFANGWDVLPGVLNRLSNEAENEIDHKYAVMYAEYMQYRLEREFDGLALRIKEYIGV